MTRYDHSNVLTSRHNPTIIHLLVVRQRIESTLLSSFLRGSFPYRLDFWLLVHPQPVHCSFVPLSDKIRPLIVYVSDVLLVPRKCPFISFSSSQLVLTTWFPWNLSIFVPVKHEWILTTDGFTYQGSNGVKRCELVTSGP